MIKKLLALLLALCLMTGGFTLVALAADGDGDLILIFEDDAERAIENQDELLSGMGGKFQFRFLTFVWSGDDKRFPHPVFHVDSLMQIGKSRSAGKRESFAAAGDGI